MNKIKFILTDYLGSSKEINFSKKQIKQLNKLENIDARIKQTADELSENYWVVVKIDGKEYYNAQWAQV